METCGDLHFGGTQRLACRAISARVVVLVGHHIAQTLQLRFVVDLFGPFYGAMAVPSVTRCLVVVVVVMDIGAQAACDSSDTW